MKKFLSPLLLCTLFAGSVQACTDPKAPQKNIADDVVHCANQVIEHCQDNQEAATVIAWIKKHPIATSGAIALVAAGIFVAVDCAKNGYANSCSKKCVDAVAGICKTKTCPDQNTETDSSNQTPKSSCWAADHKTALISAGVIGLVGTILIAWDLSKEEKASLIKNLIATLKAKKSTTAA